MEKGKIITGYPHVDRPWMQFYDKDILNISDPKVNMTQYLKDKTKGLDSQLESLYYGSKTLYGEFWQKVDNASKVLNGLGVKKYDRIMNLVPNIPETGELWLGATQLGIVSDYIDPRPDSMDLQANARKVLELIKYEKANHIIALDKCYLAMLKPIENELKEIGIDRIVILNADNSMNILGIINYLKDVISYNALKNEREKGEAIKYLKWYEALYKKLMEMKKDNEYYIEAVKKSPLEVVKYSDLLHDIRYSSFVPVYEPNLVNYIGHTSGTSGARPKPITLTNENQISSTEQLIKSGTKWNVGDRVLHVLPFFSPLGADNNYILTLASGAVNIEIPEFEINEFGFLLKKYHPNVIIGTPSWLSSLTKSRYLDKEDLSCITKIIYGGDSMTREDEETLNNWLRKHGCQVVVEKGHGMSEYCGCGSYAKNGYNRYESIGIPLPETIYSIVNPDVDGYLEPLKFDPSKERLQGELVVSSDAVTSGKLDDNVIVPHYEMDGKSYIRTRDIVEMDKDGIFYFNSRKDRSFTRFDGYKVKPYEIEKVIEDHPSVKYCRIVPYFDEKKRGLMPKAHIVLEGDTNDYDLKNITEDIIQKQIINNSNMSSRQIPAKVKYREAMPLTANSKVNYNALVNEGYDGSEISINVQETNLAVGSIEVLMPQSGKILSLKK